MRTVEINLFEAEDAILVNTISQINRIGEILENLDIEEDSELFVLLSNIWVEQNKLVFEIIKEADKRKWK